MKENKKRGIFSAIKASYRYLTHNWKTTTICYILELVLLAVIIFAAVRYYGPLDSSVTTIKDILEDSNTKDTASLQKLAAREAELKTLENSISSYVMEFLMIIVAGFVLVSALSYLLLGDRFGAKRLILFISIFLITQVLLFVIFGVLLDIKTATLQNIWVSEQASLSSAFFVAIVIVGNFLATTICIESFKTENKQLSFERLADILKSWYQSFKRHWFRNILTYTILNAVTITIFLLAFTMLVFPLGTVSVFLSLGITVILMPLWRIFSKSFLINYMSD